MSDKPDTSTPKPSTPILARAVAEFERDLIRERTRLGGMSTPRVLNDYFPWTRYVTGGGYLTAYVGLNKDGRDHILVGCRHRHRTQATAERCAAKLVRDARLEGKMRRRWPSGRGRPGCGCDPWCDANDDTCPGV